MFRLAPALLLFFAALSASAMGADKITYEDHIEPIFRQHCMKCHGNDEQEAGLNLQSFGAALKGGSGGKVLVPGRASQSLLYQSITNEDDDLRMPPNKPPIPMDQIDLVRQWIDTGMLETASGIAMIQSRDLSFSPSSDVGNEPDVPPMPVSLPEIALPITKRPLPVLAIDTSPWAPLLAVACQQHVRLVNTQTRKTIGHLAFPEGVPHVIRFSSDGSILLVAGGTPVQKGLVVLFDVKSGKRLAEIGDELDSVLAADLSPDQKRVALGGSSKVVKVYSTTDGKLLYQLTKHTDWITALSFSPSGTKLATGDRAGGMHLWDSVRGDLLLNLAEHQSAITSIDWRLDSRLLASSGDDGNIIWWDASDGFPAINKSNDHSMPRPPGRYGKLPNGVLNARFSRSGRLATVGRNHATHLYDVDGNVLNRYKFDDAMPLCTAVTHDERSIVAGYTNGEIKFWNAQLSDESVIE
tara:strand:+ start:216122 stop:217525 length:1404 start_codon:yes stop_codon:yes gene_type:complete